MTDSHEDDAELRAWRLAQSQGRVIQELPLDQIVPDHMMRDRMVVDAADLDELKASIRSHGLRLPIEVIPLEDGRYGLISGWRRVTVLQQLHEEDPDAYATVKALISTASGEAAAYTAMVEENELRAQITPYERGRIAVMAARLGAFSDTESAIETLFATASKAKRSKIRSFAYVHKELGDMLLFPTDLSERNGLRLAYALREGYSDQLRHVLIGSARGGPALEWARLEAIVVMAEAIERRGDFGGRPKTPFARPSGRVEPLANGISMERVLHEDGYSIRMRGTVVNIEMIELLMNDLRRRLSPLRITDR